MSDKERDRVGRKIQKKNTRKRDRGKGKYRKRDSHREREREREREDRGGIIKKDRNRLG